MKSLENVTSHCNNEGCENEVAWPQRRFCCKRCQAISKKNRHNPAVRLKVKNAVDTGLLVPAIKCELCEKRAKTVAHHWAGYDYPLDVWWLCISCNKITSGDRFHNGSVSKRLAKQFVRKYRQTNNAAR